MSIEEYSIQDLARAFFREFLIQNRFGKTYEAFENQDVRSKQKIPKASLIKQLCMEHLVVMNKKLQKPYKSLSEILIYYLKNKFLAKQKENNSMEKSETDTKQLQSISRTTLNIANPGNIAPPPQIITQKQKSQQVNKQHNNSNEENGFLPSRATNMRRLVKKQKDKSQSNTLFEQKIKVQQNFSKEDLVEDIQKFESPLIINKPPFIAKNQGEIQKKVKSNPLEINHPLEKKESLNNEQKTYQSKPSNEPVIEKKMMMFGKRKVQQKEQQKKQHAIFKNFVDQDKPIQKITYKYQAINLNKITVEIPEQVKVDISYKKPQMSLKPTKKKQKSIPYDVSSSARKLLFQGLSKSLPKSWCQGILLSPFENTFYGLQQIEGGPCGIIAALQCYYLKHLLYLYPTKNYSTEVKQNCVIGAISQLLYKLNPNKVVLALPAVATYSNEPISIQSTELLIIQNIKSFDQLYEQIYQYKTIFMGKSNHGYTLLLYSCILTKGCQQIEQQMDNKENALIGNHGHCTQQLVNMFLTGKARSNCFDGIRMIGQGNDCIKLKGIQGKQQFGFLTIFETLGYLQVGKSLKNPLFPIWVISKQFHYHVVFGNHYLISSDNQTEKFDLIYFDGLYNCGDKIVLTLQKQQPKEKPQAIKNLPLIEQVLLTKWGRRSVDWNGSIKIL